MTRNVILYAMLLVFLLIPLLMYSLVVIKLMFNVYEGQILKGTID